MPPMPVGSPAQYTAGRVVRCSSSTTTTPEARLAAEQARELGIRQQAVRRAEQVALDRARWPSLTRHRAHRVGSLASVTHVPVAYRVRRKRDQHRRGLHEGMDGRRTRLRPRRLRPSQSGACSATSISLAPAAARAAATGNSSRAGAGDDDSPAPDVHPALQQCLRPADSQDVLQGSSRGMAESVRARRSREMRVLASMRGVAASDSARHRDAGVGIGIDMRHRHQDRHRRPRSTSTTRRRWRETAPATRAPSDGAPPFALGRQIWPPGAAPRRPRSHERRRRRRALPPRFRPDRHPPRGRRIVASRGSRGSRRSRRYRRSRRSRRSRRRRGMPSRTAVMQARRCGTPSIVTRHS